MTIPWFGLWPLSFWGYALFLLLMVHITVMGVTLYLHRDQAHRSLDLHPILQHFFRFWGWLTTGMSTRAWVSIHRKHHALCETEEDPHSPQYKGIKKVVLEGAELYRDANEAETLEKYGHGTPNDWLENRVYLAQPILGVALMMVIDLILFGVVGLTIWAIQMMAIPLLAAGVINGIGHFWGYRNFDSDDTSTNVLPWGTLMGGEELHNNHHAFPSSAKFSYRWWEFDIGWMYIKLFSLFGLAKVRRCAKTPNLIDNKETIDLDMVKELIAKRMFVLQAYRKKVFKPSLQKALANTKSATWRKRLRRLNWHNLMPANFLSKQRNADADAVCKEYDELGKVQKYKEQLKSLWSKTATNNEELLERVQAWCKNAEASGIESLKEFSYYLRTLQATSKA